MGFGDVYTELSPNQKQALEQPCRACHDGKVVERYGRYGPWVQCSKCGDKVRRPRGKFGGVPQVPLQGFDEVPPLTPMQQQMQQMKINIWENILGPDGKPDESKPQGMEQIKQDKVYNGESQGKPPRSEVEDAILGIVNKRIDTLKDELGALVEMVTEDAKATPVTIEVKQLDESVTKVEGAHYLMPRLLRLVNAGITCYPWGPAGSGKTTAARQAAEALKRGSEIDTLDPSTFRSMVQGYMTPTGEPVHTTFTRCWTEGFVYIADETDNAPGHVQTLFNSALANGHAPLAWGNVARKDGFSFIGTGNTPGRPTREFPDRRPMSAAFMDRLYFIHWPIDPQIEQRAGGLRLTANPSRTERSIEPKAWVTWVLELRAWASKNMPTLMITPRASLIGLQALALGETPEEVADGLIFRGCDVEMRTKALTAVKLP